MYLLREAAGWTVWNCERSPESQEIRLACTGEPELCAHVFQDGAVDTIVRLPESCGIGPFARIAKSRDVVKERLPSHVSEVATNSRKPPPSIHAFTIDTDFGKIPTGRGNVQFVISATNLPDQSAYFGKEALQEGLRRRSSMKFGKRGWINEFFQHLTAVNSTHKAVQKVDISKSSSLVNMDVECGQVTGHVDVDVDASVQASISYGYIVVGTLVPLHIEDFGLFAGVTSEIAAKFNVHAAATGEVDLVYPPEHGASIVHVTPLDAPFQLNLVSGASAEGSITVHLIPRIECSISLLGGVGIANVFVQVDVSPRLRGDIRASKFYSTTSDAVNALNGCLDLTNSVHVSAGAEGTLLPLDTVNTVYNLFEKEDHLWKECFGYVNHDHSSVSTLVLPMPETIRSTRQGLSTAASPSPSSVVGLNRYHARDFGPHHICELGSLAGSLVKIVDSVFRPAS
ncbi:hypothetical protein FRC03_009337 [Tulasnella sp. 419]|nr:hypothetical protein FRC03_009337 [Tulasnella sp. 419]